MEGRNQFAFYRSFYNAIQKAPKRHQLKLFTSIVEYALDKTEPDGLSLQVEGHFDLIRPVLDSAWRKAASGSIGGKISKRGKAKISKGEKEIEIDTEKEIERDTEGEAFRRFWERYPLKLGMYEAAQAFALVCEHYESDFILNALCVWMESAAWKRENGRYIPKATKWLEEKWFLQEPVQELPKGASGKLGQAELEAIQKLLKED